MEKTAKPFADIAARIRWHRLVLGLDQKEYSAEAGLSRNQLSNWETGKYRISIDGALAINKAFSLSLDFIYLGDADTLPMSLMVAWREREGTDPEA